MKNNKLMEKLLNYFNIIETKAYALQFNLLV